ncbi:MAG: hypothetical protein H6Q67_138 [Firmicutes bacterium]|nr:hypothetical protein [Bacillota bacterium]
MDLIVTTIYNPPEKIQAAAQALAAQLNATLIKREKNSIETLKNLYNVIYILVATQSGPVVYTPGGQYFFHINMAELRINNIKIGKHDHMITALGLTPGASVLDCTLGLGTDAIVASFVAGPSGKVIGLENSPIIAAITRLGLDQYNAANETVTTAMRRIQVETADYNNFLTTLPAKSFDVVYFDPMFRAPVYSSSNLKPIRTLADDRPLSIEAVKQACRVARMRVVIKETKRSKEFSRLGITTILGGKYSSVHYGVMEVGG